MRFRPIGEPHDDSYTWINKYASKHCPKSKQQIAKDKEEIKKAFKKFNIEVKFEEG